VITDWLWVGAWLCAWNGLEVNVKVRSAAILTVPSMGGVDKTVLVSKAIIIGMA
jgi:hypothetical protein